MVELRSPKLRKGSYFLGLLESCRMDENALTALIPAKCKAFGWEADIQGLSTRSVDHRGRAMRMSGVSKSQVSRLCEESD